jgi:hypothetical protein
VNRTGPAAATSIQEQIRPSSSQVPSTSSPSGASRAAVRAHASGTSDSSYCRSTFIARISTGRSSPGVGTSNPPSAKATPSTACAAASSTRAGSISRPSTRTPGATPRSRAASSSVVQARAP